MKTKKLSKTKINNGIFNAVIYILLLLLAVIMLYPLIFVLSASFSDPKAVAGGRDAAASDKALSGGIPVPDAV